MNLRKLWFWFWSTLLIGGASTFLVTLLLMLFDNFFAEDVNLGGYLFNAFNTIISGMTFGAFALMGFFAYLMINYIALSIFRKPELWKSIQVILTIVTLVDLVVLPLYLFEEPNSWYFYCIVPVVLLIGSIFIARQKVKATNANAWVPTMFFLIVGTTIEIYPALKVDSFKEITFMLVPIFICNAWQILQLHKLVRRDS